jgi:hypothetical protein
MVDALIDECRDTCLWWQRRDYYPETDEDRRRVLSDIERRADRRTFQRAARLRLWLSRHSSSGSAAS